MPKLMVDDWKPCFECQEQTAEDMKKIAERLARENPTWHVDRVKARAYIEYMKGVRQ